jgi:hypothetical protein
VYGLLALYYALIQDYFTAGALFFLGIIFLSIAPDFVIRPKLARSRAAIHPAITLIAFAAPVFVIGPIGIIIGPLTYGFLLAAFRTKKKIEASQPQAEIAAAGSIEGLAEKTEEKSIVSSIERSAERSVEASSDHVFVPEINPWH